MGLFTRKAPASGPPSMPFWNNGTMGAGYPAGHAPPLVQQQAQMQLHASTREIATMKNVPVLNPNYGMLAKYLQVLDR